MKNEALESLYFSPERLVSVLYRSAVTWPGMTPVATGYAE